MRAGVELWFAQEEKNSSICYENAPVACRGSILPESAPGVCEGEAPLLPVGGYDGLTQGDAAVVGRQFLVQHHSEARFLQLARALFH